MNDDRVRWYRNILAEDPTSRIFVELAEVLYSRGEYREVVEVCRQGLDLHPSLLRARVLLGLALWQEGETSACELELTRVRQELEKNADIYRVLADLYWRQGQLGSACRVLDTYLQLRPNDSEARAVRRRWDEQILQPPLSPETAATIATAPSAADHPPTAVEATAPPAAADAEPDFGVATQAPFLEPPGPAGPARRSSFEQANAVATPCSPNSIPATVAQAAIGSSAAAPPSEPQAQEAPAPATPEPPAPIPFNPPPPAGEAMRSTFPPPAPADTADRSATEAPIPALRATLEQWHADLVRRESTAERLEPILDSSLRKRLKDLLATAQQSG